MFHPSDPPPVPLRRPASAAASYHVGLDTMMGRRSRHRPEEVAIDGFLLLDTGEYELVTAHHPARRLLEDEGPRHPRPGPHREPGSGRTTLRRIPRSAASGWSMATSSCPRPGRPAAKTTRRAAGSTVGRNSFHSRTSSWRASRTAIGSGADDPAERVFRLRVRAVYSLDRVAIEPKGPRFIETLHVRDMLPEFQTD